MENEVDILKCKFKAIVLLATMFLVSCGINAPQAEIRNYTIREIDVKNDKIIVKGHMHSKLELITDYLTRVEDNAMYVKIMHQIPYDRKSPRTFFFEKELPLPNNIEKIYFEDENRKIMVWDKSQGYGEVDIEDIWKEELKKLQ